MEFTYDFDKIEIDEDTGDIYIGVMTDEEIDTIWADKVSELITRYNDEIQKKCIESYKSYKIFKIKPDDFESSKCDFELSKCYFEIKKYETYFFRKEKIIIELKIPFCLRKYFCQQHVLNSQKYILNLLSYSANIDLEDRIYNDGGAYKFIEKIKQLYP